MRPVWSTECIPGLAPKLLGNPDSKTKPNQIKQKQNKTKQKLVASGMLLPQLWLCRSFWPRGVVTCLVLDSQVFGRALNQQVITERGYHLLSHLSVNRGGCIAVSFPLSTIFPKLSWLLHFVFCLWWVSKETWYLTLHAVGYLSYCTHSLTS